MLTSGDRVYHALLCKTKTMQAVNTWEAGKTPGVGSGLGMGSQVEEGKQ